MFALQASRYVHDMLTYMPVFIGRSVRPFVRSSFRHACMCWLFVLGTKWVCKLIQTYIDFSMYTQGDMYRHPYIYAFVCNPSAQQRRGYMYLYFNAMPIRLGGCLCIALWFDK